MNELEQQLARQEIGSIRKPEWLLRTLRDPKLPQEVKERARDDLAYLNIKLFEDAGLDIVYDGEARRVEMYEYPIRRIRGFEFCGRVRSWDNKYFLKARCTGKVEYVKPYHLEEMLFVKQHARAEFKVPVTGPYTLADWSFNEHYPTRDLFIYDLAKNVIRPLLRDLASAGAQRIQIDEPAATTHPREMRLFVEALNEALAGVEAKVNLHICYSGNEYLALFPECLELNVNQFTLEFANRDTLSLGLDREHRKGYSPLNLFKEYGDKRAIGLGVVDVHSDEIESPELVRDRILFAQEALEGENMLYVNPDCGLRTRSRKVAFNKLRNMVEGAKLASEALGL